MNALRKPSTDSFSALQAHCHVVHLLVKEIKPFSIGKCIRKCLQHTLQEMCPPTEALGRHFFVIPLKLLSTCLSPAVNIAASVSI